MDILSKTKDFFIKNEIKNCKIGVAFSGGADSTALFLLLLDITPIFNLELCAIHVNYNLRGQDSAADEIFVRKLSEKHGLKIFVKSADLSQTKSNLEEVARNERYDFFRELQKEENIKYIATAHNANDQAETLLFRLARKTGIAGAAGIPPIREDGIIRPLLHTTRSEILEYLAQKNQTFREDKTNADVKFSRNRIRANIIPELEKINLNAVLNIVQFCDFVRGDGRFSKSSNISSFLIDKETCIDEIRETCYENGLILNFAHCTSIEACKTNTGATVLLPDFTMFVLKNALFFTKFGENSINIEETQITENDKILHISDLWKIEIMDKMPPKGENYAVIQKSDFPLQVKKLSALSFVATKRGEQRPPQDSPLHCVCLKNDTKTVNERMKKAGVSKFERENSPAVFSASGELLATAFVAWKFDGGGEGFRWLRVETTE
ncbi:MAG: tRNA lysidine(34) synthetase TilS [Chitinivibrionia bacterium]|nr:tRNA lysidine(34) synthetase TilS [Chitinivibrionia bacterium]